MNSIRLFAYWAIAMLALGGLTFYFTRPPKEVVCDCDRCRVLQSGELNAADSTLALGSNLPEIQGNWVTSGKKHPELAAHVTLIDFWGTACLPCRLAIPANNAIYAAYAPKGLVFVGVSIDPVAALLDYKDSVRMDYPLLSAPQSVFLAFGVQYTPSAFLFDKQGKLIWKGVRLEEKDGTLVSSFENALKSTLSGPDAVPLSEKK